MTDPRDLVRQLARQRADATAVKGARVPRAISARPEAQVWPPDPRRPYPRHAAGRDAHKREGWAPEQLEDADLRRRYGLPDERPEVVDDGVRVVRR